MERETKLKLFKALNGVVMYIELLLCAISATLLAAAILAQDSTTAIVALWSGLCCCVVGAILVGWRKYKEQD